MLMLNALQGTVSNELGGEVGPAIFITVVQADFSPYEFFPAKLLEQFLQYFFLFFLNR